MKQWRRYVSKHWIEDTVREYVSSLLRKTPGYQIHNCEDSTWLLCCLSSPCLTAFFSIVPQNSHVENFVLKVEAELRDWRDEKKWEYLDLNLILLLEKLDGPQVLSDIRHDTTLCRKFIFFPRDPPDLLNKLALLPFSPLDAGKALELRVLSLSPETILKRSGASDRFARDLVDHSPGANPLARKVIKTDYMLKGKADEYIDTITKGEHELPNRQYPNQYEVALEKIKLRNFRGIGRNVDIPLGKGITVLFGINGTGKTSVCDAIEWAVTGSLARVEKHDSDAKPYEAERSIINYFAKDYKASVELKFNSTGGHVKRSVSDDLMQTVSSSEGDNDWGGILAATHSKRRPGLDLRRAREAFRSSHILEQSTIRDFLNRDPIERFEALNRILGYEELIRLTRKLGAVRSYVEDEVLKREPQRSEAAQMLREQEDEAKAIEKSIKNRETALPSQSTSDRVFKEAVAEAKSCEIPTPEPPKVTSLPEMKQWLTDTTEAMNAVDKSLKDTLEKAGGYLQLAIEVEAEKKYIEELKQKISMSASEDKKLREKAVKLENELVRIDTKKAEFETNLNSIHREIVTLQWLSSNAVILRQEEIKLKEEQAEMVRVDEQVNKHQDVLHQLKDRLNIITEQIMDKIQEMKRIEVKRANIEELLNLCNEWSQKVAFLTELYKDSDDLGKRIARYEKDIKSLRKKQMEAHKNQIKLSNQVDAEEAVSSRRSKLLAELRQTLSSSDKACPFCGFEYNDHKDLLSHLEKVEEAPTEAYQLALSKAKEAEKKLSLLEDELKTTENLLLTLKHEKEENAHKVNAVKIRLLEFRNKAATVNILPQDSDDNFIPEEAQLHDVLSQLNVSNMQQTIENIKLKEQDLQIRISKIQKEIRMLTTKRRSIIARIEERIENVNKLRSQAIKKGVSDFLTLSESEIEERIDRLQQTVEDTICSVREIEERKNRTAKKRTSILQKVEDIKRQMKQWQQQVLDASQKEAKLKGSLISIGIQAGISASALIEFQVGLESRIGRINKLRKKCSILSDILQLDTLRGELSQVKQKVKHEKNALDKINKEIRDVKRKLLEIEHVSMDFQRLTVMDMTNTLKALETPLNNIFERLNGHPLFGALRIEPNENNKTVIFRVETQNNKRGSSDMETTPDVPPRSYLSDAQINIVSLSIFLSIALYHTWSKFRLIVIDDPVQQMDDLNAASFIDLIREVSIQNRRQFLITTCNDEFYRLALSKLSCLNTKGVTLFRAYRLEGLRREGPEIIVDAPYWDNKEVRVTESN